MKKNTLISCIIPVYNEKSRVIKVLEVLVNHLLIDEVIVVNDGSTDGGGEILRKVKGIKLISYKQNRGKSYAVMLGIKAAKNSLILTIDSDLHGLSMEDVTALVKPVLDGEVKFVMTLRKNSLGIFKLFGLDFVSGERIFDKNLLGNIDDLGKLRPFGLEVFMNGLVLKKGLKVKVVNWKNVITPRKAKKFGFWQGTKADFKMVKQIIGQAGFFGMAKQFWLMWWRKV